MVEDVDHFVAYAERASEHGAPPLLDAGDLKGAREGLAALAAYLDSNAPLRVRGVALTRSLARQGISNLVFSPSPQRALGDVVAEALAETDPRDEAPHDRKSSLRCSARPRQG
jgi:hypothetical protein